MENACSSETGAGCLFQSS